MKYKSLKNKKNKGCQAGRRWWVGEKEEGRLWLTSARGRSVLQTLLSGPWTCHCQGYQPTGHPQNFLLLIKPIIPTFSHSLHSFVHSFIHSFIITHTSHHRFTLSLTLHCSPPFFFPLPFMGRTEKIAKLKPTLQIPQGNPKPKKKKKVNLGSSSSLLFSSRINVTHPFTN